MLKIALGIVSALSLNLAFGSVSAVSPTDSITLPVVSSSFSVQMVKPGSLIKTISCPKPVDVYLGNINVENAKGEAVYGYNPEMKRVKDGLAKVDVLILYKNSKALAKAGSVQIIQVCSVKKQLTVGGGS